jgi:hypothetical protein
MTDPVTFDSASPRFGLPLLFAGQSQKEVYVNEAHILVDALLHCAVESIANTPPASPADGLNWIVGSTPSGIWSGLAGRLACRQGSAWIYVTPRDGLCVLNRANGQKMQYFGAWQAASSVTAPAAGTVIDNESRAAIGQIIAALRVSGILTSS